MQVDLIPFPTVPHPDIAIGVTIARHDTMLDLGYHLTGAVGSILLPPPDAASRADGLWQHSCFEAFARPAGGDAYVEFNFAPSRAWATYRFARYREGMHDATGLAQPEIMIPPADTGYALRAVIELPTAGPVWLNLAAVIEEIGGRKSYWALAHPPDKPDFHHPDCFVLELPAAG